MARRKENKIYDSKALARFFDVTEETIYEWCGSGKVPAFKIGKKWRVRAEDLRKMIDGKVASRKPDAKQRLF